MQSTVGRFPAIGVTSGVLGHHVAYPVHRAAEFVGVACVEVDMEHIAAQSDAFVRTETGSGDRAWIRVLTDCNGVIILSSEPSWLYRAVATIAHGALEDIRRYKQYPGRDLAELERFDSTDTHHLASSMPELRVRGLRWRDTFGDLQEGLFAIRESKIVGDWRVLIFWRLNIAA
jgi:C4-dicarboxylate-specific signal transduction histidine kinase